MTSRVSASVVLAVLLLAACSGGSDDVAAVSANEAQADGGGWRGLATQAEDVERHDTLAEMGMAADVVVIAKATGVEGGNDLIQVRFEVIRAISDLDEDSVAVELDAVMSSTALAALPPALLVLREKGTEEEAGSYRLVNDLALWTEQPDGGVFPPLYESPYDGRFASELGEIEGLEDLGDHLEVARRGCDGECGLSQAAWNR